MPHRWNTAAADRRRQIESGLDYTFCRVFQPLYRDLLPRFGGHSLLEVGCGTGHLALMFSQVGIATTALEPSAGMHAEASDVLRGSSVRLLNTTVEAFPVQPFDIVLSHLCAQAVQDLPGFLAASGSHLGSGGRLVFSIPHPCFYNGYKGLIPAADFTYSRETSTEASFSITAEPGTVFSGVPYHHRPLSNYFAAIAGAGLVATEFLEPWPSDDVQALYGQRWKTPRYCVFVCARRQP
jgi:SAM-dependent methyltransferase